METYDVQKYASLLVKGNLHDAIRYMGLFPEHDEITKKYHMIFEKNEEFIRSENTVINALDYIYQKYYKDIFWNKISNDQAELELFENLWDFCGRREDIEKNMYIEDEVEKIVRKEGYEFLGGITAGYYGPYIWEKSHKETYEVALPSGNEQYTVIMMDGFVSRSWLDFLSLGQIGTGGWIGKDGTLCCVSSSYDTASPSFKISFLKHEAQHGYDKRTFPHATSSELEYRAKLVEIIYWEDEKIIKKIHFEADNRDEKNTHSVASHRIISDLSKKLYNKNFEDNITRFTDHINKIKSAAKELLNEDTVRLSS